MNDPEKRISSRHPAGQHDLPDANRLAPGDLDWQAFQYIADELSENEVQAFELRLESDQRAREAVANALLLTRNISAAFESSNTVATTSQPAAWHGILLAAAAVFMLSMAGFWYSFQSKAPQPTADNNDSVALVWADLLVDVSSEVELAIADDAIELALDSDDSSDQVSWMITALSDLELGTNDVAIGNTAPVETLPGEVSAAGLRPEELSLEEVLRRLNGEALDGETQLDAAMNASGWNTEVLDTKATDPNGINAEALKAKGPQEGLPHKKAANAGSQTGGQHDN